MAELLSPIGEEDTKPKEIIYVGPQLGIIDAHSATYEELLSAAMDRIERHALKKKLTNREYIFLSSKTREVLEEHESGQLGYTTNISDEIANRFMHDLYGQDYKLVWLTHASHEATTGRELRPANTEFLRQQAENEKYDLGPE